MHCAPQQCKSLLRQDFGKEITKGHDCIDIVGLWVCADIPRSCIVVVMVLKEGNFDYMKRTQDKRKLVKVKA